MDGQLQLPGLEVGGFWMCRIDPAGDLDYELLLGEKIMRRPKRRPRPGGWIVLAKCPRCSTRYGRYCGRHDGARHAAQNAKTRLPVDLAGGG